MRGVLHAHATLLLASCPQMLKLLDTGAGTARTSSLIGRRRGRAQGTLTHLAKMRVPFAAGRATVRLPVQDVFAIAKVQYLERNIVFT